MTLRQLVLCVYPNCVKNIQKGTSVFTQFCIRTEIHGTHTVRNIHVVNGRGYTVIWFWVPTEMHSATVTNWYVESARV